MTSAPHNHDTDNPVRASLLVCSAITLFAVQDVIIRLLGDDYSLMQILVIRAVVVIVLTLLFLGMKGKLHLLRSRRWGWLVVRGVLLFLSFTFYYLAVVSIPIAAAVSIYFVSPLILTGLAAVFASETVGIRRWVAVLLGLLGVVIIMRPGSSSVDPAALLALAGALVYALFNLLTRRLARTESAWGLSFHSNIVGYLVIPGILGIVMGNGSFADESHPALGFMSRAWIIPDLYGFAMIFTIGCIATFGFYGLTEGYRTAPSSFVAPFEYLIIPWSVFWGYLIWNEVPHVMTFAGIALILGSGMYVIMRERVVGQRLVTGKATRLRP